MKNSQKAFTLIELAITLVVVGFLVAGVIGVKVMLDAAQVTSVIGDIKKFSEATDTFQGIYGGLPGDISDISALPVVTPAAVPGNGNGIIDSGQETLQFWYHLMAAGVLPGSFDGSSAFTLALSGQRGGVPGGKITQSGYTVTNDATFGLTFTFGRFSSSSSSLPVVTPAEASSIDARVDDGKPGTGNVQAQDGAGVTAGGCVSGGAYVASTDTPTCILKFFVSKKAVSSVSATAITCSGAPLGTARVSTTVSCPTGYTGNVIESCMAINDVGTWVSIQQMCNIISCGDGSVEEDERTVACPTGYTGSMTQTCQSTGIWQNTDNDCIVSIPASVCTDGQYSSFSCPLGQTGVVRAECTNNEWVVDANGCYDIDCGVAIGAIGASASCPATGYSGGSVTQACSLTASLVPVSNNCLPSYGGCSADATREIACPAGYTGSYWQKCSGGNWSTDDSPGKGNSCIPASCGGYPIGYVQSAPNISCDVGSVGVVVQICGSDGKWEINKGNCGQIQCPMVTDAGPPSLSWTEAASGAQNVADTTGQAYRDCLLDGNWGNIRGGSCPAETSSNANWVVTAANTVATIGVDGNTCIPDYVAGTGITRQCLGNGGGWANATASCVQGTSIQGVDFW